MTTTPTAIPRDPIPPDMRTLDKMLFTGFDDVTPDLVRSTLQAAGVVHACDIEQLGCTGLCASGCDTKMINKVRVAMGGGGVGLPCFVPPTRFCLAHNTIGGLMSGQRQFFEQFVPMVSRDLTLAERGHAKLVEAAQHTRSEDSQRRNVVEVLAGYKLPDGFEEMPEEDQEEIARGAEATLEARETRPSTLAPDDWKCPEHSKTDWRCRYCVAQAIVDGPLEPTYTLRPLDLPPDKEVVVPLYGISAEDALMTLDRCETAGATKVYVYVLAATFTRKLARD